MFKWLLGLWYKELRRTDLQILWPACKAQTSDLDHAKAAFAIHAMHDQAWLFLGKDAVISFIDELV